MNDALTTGPIHDMPVTLGGLRFLTKERLLDAETYEKILYYINMRPTEGDWAHFGLRCLVLTGLLFCVAGIICFFAWNWADMSHFLKFAIIIGLMLIGGGITLWRGPDSLPGSLGLLAAGLLAGPLLAVYGQYYQTGADAWELFRAWTLFLLPLALLGRQNGLWLAVWLIGSTWGVLYIDQIMLHGNRNNFVDALSLPIFLSMQFAALLIWEAAMYQARNRADSFLQQACPARIVALCLLVMLSGLTAAHIVGYEDIFYKGLSSSQNLHILLYMALTAGGLYWYRRMRPDMLLVTFLLLGLIGQIMTMLFTAFDLFNGAGMLFAAIVLMGLGFGAARLVLRWQRITLSRAAAEREHGHRLAQLKQRLLFVKSYMLQDLWQAMGLPHADDAVQVLEQNLAHLTPWYIRLILTICAWVAAIFLIAFLGFVISFTFDDTPKMSLLVFSLIFIGLAAMLTRLDALFPVQFGLALGLAGALSMPASVIWIFEMESWFHIPVLISFIICYFAIPHQAMRCLAAFVCIFIGLDLLAGFYAFLCRQIWNYADNAALWLRMCLFCLLALAALTPALVAMLRAWRKESQWIQDATRDAFIRPLLIALVAAFLCFGGLWCAVGPYGWQWRFWMQELYPRYYYMLSFFKYSGLAAGLALIYLAISLSKTTAATTGQKSFVIAGAVLILIVGWWLPWFPIAVLILALSRYLGNVALAGLTGFYLAACIAWYYISMHTTLLYKTYTLLGAGITMLLAGYAVYRFFGERIKMPLQGGAHA